MFVPQNYKSIQGMNSTPLLRQLHGELRQVFGTHVAPGLSRNAAAPSMHQILQHAINSANGANPEY